MCWLASSSATRSRRSLDIPECTERSAHVVAHRIRLQRSHVRCAWLAIAQESAADRMERRCRIHWGFFIRISIPVENNEDAGYAEHLTPAAREDLGDLEYWCSPCP